MFLPLDLSAQGGSRDFRVSRDFQLSARGVLGMSRIPVGMVPIPGTPRCLRTGMRSAPGGFLFPALFHLHPKQFVDVWDLPGLRDELRVLGWDGNPWE